MSRKRRSHTPTAAPGGTSVSPAQPEAEEWPGIFLIIPPYPLYRTAILYAVVWVFFFLIPLYIVNASLNKGIVAPLEFLFVACLSLLTIIRFGALASLPHVVVISGLLFAARANPEVHELTNLVFVTISGMYLYFFARNLFQIHFIIKKTVALTDDGIRQINRDALPTLASLQRRKRLGVFGSVAAAMGYLVWTITSRPELGGLGWFLPLSLVLHFLLNYYLIEFDRFYVFDDGQRRRLAYFGLRYLDKQFVDFLQARGAGLVIFLSLYGFVIISFAFTYYYIDHCSDEDIVCSRLVDLAQFNVEPTEQSPFKNFNSIKPQLGCDEKKANCAITLGQFLPYLYFSVVTTTTVGYGDISPRSVTAVWLVILHHIISIALLIGVAGQVAGLVARQRTR